MFSVVFSEYFPLIVTKQDNIPQKKHKTKNRVNHDSQQNETCKTADNYQSIEDALMIGKNT